MQFAAIVESIDSGFALVGSHIAVGHCCFALESAGFASAVASFGRFESIGRFVVCMLFLVFAYSASFVE